MLLKNDFRNKCRFTCRTFDFVCHLKLAFKHLLADGTLNFVHVFILLRLCFERDYQTRESLSSDSHAWLWTGLVRKSEERRAFARPRNQSFERKLSRFRVTEWICECKSVLLSCRSAFRFGLVARGFWQGTVRGMLARARCDRADDSRPRHGCHAERTATFDGRRPGVRGAPKFACVGTGET